MHKIVEVLNFTVFMHRQIKSSVKISQILFDYWYTCKPSVYLHIH